MRMRRRIIKPKTPIFLGCEGESEQAYGQLLNDLLQAAGHPVHLEVVNLSPGAGDPASRLRRAGSRSPGGVSGVRNSHAGRCCSTSIRY